MKKLDIKKLVLLAMLTALSYVVVAVFPPIKIIGFLSYEPKDVIIVIAGFMLNPLATVIISVVVSAIEMFTISTTGFYGFVMNAISSCAFALPAALIYKEKHSAGGAIIGLAVGSVATTIAMLLFNYIITPWYMEMPREAVAAMLIPTFLPFNAIKSALNSALTLALYKPLVLALQKAHLLPARPQGQTAPKIWVYILSAALLVTCILLLLVIQGKL